MPWSDCARTIFVVPFYDYGCITMKYWVSFVLPCLFAISNAVGSIHRRDMSGLSQLPANRYPRRRRLE